MNKNFTISFYFNKSITLFMLMVFTFGFAQVASQNIPSGITGGSAINPNFSVTKNGVR